MPKKIQLIIGSTRQNRIAPKVATWVQAQMAKNSDLELEVVDLKEWNLPFMDAPVPPAYGPVDTPEANAWRAKINEADGHVFLTAEYNRSIPAPLKNAIDYLSGEWKEKPVAIVSYGYIDGGLSATRHLQDVMAWLKMKAVETTVAVHFPKEWLDENGQLQLDDDKLAVYNDKLQATLAQLVA